jgi:tetratricopeptide (TPR) repeat protein
MNRMHTWMAVVVCGAGLLTAGLAWSADDLPADALLRQAYRAVVDAELAGVVNRRAEAVQSYRQAIECFGRLQTNYPGWQADAIDYRLADCRNRMVALEADGTVGGAPAVLSPSMTNTEARLAGLLDELRMVAASVRAPLDNEDAVREVGRLRIERDEAIRTAQALQRKVDRQEPVRGRRGWRFWRAPVPIPETRTNAPPLSALPAVVKAEVRRLTQAGQTAQALWLVREAERVMPGDLDLVVLHGLAACQAGQYSEAVQLLQPHDTADLTQASVLITLGSAYMGLGRVGEARVAMERGLKLAPDSAEGHYNLAQILMAIKPPDIDRAQAHYGRAMELGTRSDPEFENRLRTAIIVSRMRTRPRDKGTPVPKTSPTATLPAGSPQK